MVSCCFGVWLRSFRVYLYGFGLGLRFFRASLGLACGLTSLGLLFGVWLRPRFFRASLGSANCWTSLGLLLVLLGASLLRVSFGFGFGLHLLRVSLGLAHRASLLQGLLNWCFCARSHRPCHASETRQCFVLEFFFWFCFGLPFRTCVLVLVRA